jgi:C4-dicarboxylate-specific signal transduction histidine kinase
LNDVVNKAVGLTTNLISKSTRHFKLNCRADLPALRGNAQRIEQVVINLVVNACQALSG